MSPAASRLQRPPALELAVPTTPSQPEIAAVEPVTRRAAPTAARTQQRVRSKVRARTSTNANTNKNLSLCRGAMC